MVCINSFDTIAYYNPSGLQQTIRLQLSFTQWSAICFPSLYETNNFTKYFWILKIKKKNLFTCKKRNYTDKKNWKIVCFNIFTISIQVPCVIIRIYIESELDLIQMINFKLILTNLQIYKYHFFNIYSIWSRRISNFNNNKN
jgi:hypothetical protein